MMFAHLKVWVNGHGIDSATSSLVHDILHAEGARVADTLTRSVTHIISAFASFPQFHAAVQANIPVVRVCPSAFNDANQRACTR
jgi:hypothetical protein